MSDGSLQISFFTTMGDVAATLLGLTAAVYTFALGSMVQAGDCGTNKPGVPLLEWDWDADRGLKHWWWPFLFQPKERPIEFSGSPTEVNGERVQLFLHRVMRGSPFRLISFSFLQSMVAYVFILLWTMSLLAYGGLVVDTSAWGVILGSLLIIWFRAYRQMEYARFRPSDIVRPSKWHWGDIGFFCLLVINSILLLPMLTIGHIVGNVHTSSAEVTEIIVASINLMILAVLDTVEDIGWFYIVFRLFRDQTEGLYHFIRHIYPALMKNIMEVPWPPSSNDYAKLHDVWNNGYPKDIYVDVTTREVRDDQIRLWSRYLAGEPGVESWMCDVPQVGEWVLAVKNTLPMQEGQAGCSRCL